VCLETLQQTEPAHLNVLLSCLYDSHRLTRNSARKVKPAMHLSVMLWETYKRYALRGCRCP
jgi:hypothetical protein